MTRTKKVKLKGDPKCPICSGQGYLALNEEDDEYKRLVAVYGEYADAYMTVKRCSCLEQMRFRDKVGNALYNADVIEEGALEDHGERNLFLQSNRSDFLAHFRSYLWNRPLDYYWRMTTDMDLIDIFLGKSEEWPSVSNFARGPELLVLQLGFQSYKNIALSGVVLECLKARQFVAKPTWVVNPHDLHFAQGQHLAWSPELEYHLEEEYRKLTIKAQRERMARPNGFGFETSLDHGDAEEGQGNAKGAGRYRNLDL